MPDDRFRANLIIDGWDEPHAEDGAHRLAIAPKRNSATPSPRPAAPWSWSTSTAAGGTARSRCAPSPATGGPAGGPVAFGVKYAVLRPGRIRVGDEVDVTAWGPGEV